MSRHSIRRSLLVRTGTGIGMLLIALAITTYVLVRHGLYKELDSSIKQTASLLANQVELEDGSITFEWKEGIGTNPVITDSGLFQYWNDTTGETTRSPAMGRLDLPKFHGPNGKPEVRDITLPGHHHHARAIGIRIHPFVLPEEMAAMKADGRVIDPKSLPFTLVVARDAKHVHHILTRLRWILGLGTLGTLAIGWLVTEHTVRMSLRPINQLADHIRNRTKRDLADPIPLPENLPTELSQLAEDFTSLLGSVAATHSRERDFIRNAAHELRTPIAGLQATTELALSKPRKAEEYAESLKTCLSAASSLTELVQRLSALARIGRSSEPTRLIPVDLHAVLMECIDSVRSSIGPKSIDLEIGSPASPALVLADPTLLRVILNNLIDNALSYGQSPGVLQIAFSADQQSASLRVSNPVENLPDDLDRLFEPFFRKNQARDDMSRHLGIGQAAGWTMGLYQMFKGAHYLSHIIITCLFCWIVFLTLRRMMVRFQPATIHQPATT